jgi:ornithine--oxo-acid transaminase
VKELAAGDVAALLLEPVNGQEIRQLAPEFAAAAQEGCGKYGTLLIVDEVFTGIGRTGRMFACEHFGIRPDAVLISKALSGGYVPLGAVLVRDDLHRRFAKEAGAGLLSSTFAHNDFGLAVGLSALRILEQEDLVSKAERSGQALVEGIRTLQRRYDMIADVRGWGLLVGVEFRPPSALHTRLSGRFVASRGLLAHMAAMQLLSRYHVIASTSGRNNILRFHPPLTIQEKDIERVLQAMDGLMQDVHRFPDGISRFLLNQLIRTARTQ